MIAVELEVLAKKFDRFGWERDMGTPVGDRQVLDWMDALQDYPLDEIRDACRSAVMANPSKMPNEGHIRAEIVKARSRKIRPVPQQDPIDDKPSAEDRRRVCRDLGLPIIAQKLKMEGRA